MSALLLPLALAAALLAQEGQAVVLVVGDDGRPIAGARVRAGAVTDVVTDADGRAPLPAAGGAIEIVVDADGFLPARRRLTIVAGAPEVVTIALEPLAEFEEEVVVTASRSSTRIEDQPLRVEVIDREEIEEKALMTPGSVAMLVGETTGLRVQATAPSLGAANVRIQGLRGRYSQVMADGLPLYGGQGDSFSLLQIPPLDLGRVEVIKGVASALYGTAALGGVINLASRRPSGPEREVLLNATSLGGSDSTLWLADAPSERWQWTLLGGFHRQGRRDRNGDGWTDASGYERVQARPRLFYDNGRGGTLMATGGVIVEQRRGGTLPGGTAPDGRPFAEGFDTARSDAGVVARWLSSSGRLLSVRGSYARQAQDRRFGTVRERGTRDTSFAEASLQGASRGHDWVVGGALQRDGYRARDLSGFDYVFAVPAVFAQDEFALGAVRLSLSGRVDAHSQYGSLASPRASLLWHPATAWRVRVSGGGGAFAPTPFVEDTDETGLSRLLPLESLEAERAWGGSIDVTRAAAELEVTATLFASRVMDPVQLAERADGRFALVNADGPSRTWGGEALARYRSGPVLAIATYAFVSARELDDDSGRRRVVPLTPRHYAALDVMIEDEGWGRVGIEVYYVGSQELEDNPYRQRARSQLMVGALVERRFGRLRVFANAENLGDLRQTRDDPLLRPTRHADGRWTVDAWGPLDGRVVNAGIRVGF